MSCLSGEWRSFALWKDEQRVKRIGDSHFKVDDNLTVGVVIVVEDVLRFVT